MATDSSRMYGLGQAGLRHTPLRTFFTPAAATWGVGSCTSWGCGGGSTEGVWTVMRPVASM